MIQGVYNHHMVYVDITKRVNNVAQCPGQTTMNSAVGNILSAQDDQARDKQWFAVQDGSMKSGYYLAGENKIFQFGELVNYTNETQDVFMQTTLEYVPQNVGSYLDASLQVVSVTSCGTGSGPGGYGVTQPKGMMAWNSKSKDLTIAEDGFLIGTRKSSAALDNFKPSELMLIFQSLTPTTGPCAWKCESITTSTADPKPHMLHMRKWHRIPKRENPSFTSRI